MAAGYTVVKEDTVICKDGEPVNGCNMSGLPEDFHALQWDGSNGHVEWVGRHSTPVSSKSEIESALGVSLPTLIERRDARIAEIKKKESDYWEAQK